MAGVLIRLKLATLRHSWRGGEGSTLGLGAAIGLALAVWTWYQAVSADDLAAALDLLAVSFAVWALIWIVLPVVGGSGGDPLQPESFRLLPIPPRRLALGLLSAAAVGVLPPVTLLAFAGLVLVAAEVSAAAVLVAVAAVGLSLALVIVLSRVIVGAMGLAMESRLGLELAAIQYALLVALSLIWLPIGLAAADDGGSGTDRFESLPSLADAARVIPTGWGAVAVDSVESGDWPVAIGALVGLLALTALLVLAWANLLARRLRGERAASTRATGRAAVSRVLRRLGLASGALGAVVGKELAAWLRHPRRTLELRVAIWCALFLAVIPGAFGARELLWPSAGAVIVVIAAVGLANVYGMDGTSVWLTVLTPSSAEVDVRGRQLAWLLTVGPLAFAVTVLLTAGAGDADAWPWAVATLPALLGAAAGLGVLLALRVPAPLPERRGGDPLDLGEDPTTGSALMLHGLVVILAVPLLAAPAGLAVWLLPGPAHWLGLLVGLSTGALYAWWLGRLGIDYLERNGPELLDSMKARPAPRPVEQPRDDDSEAPSRPVSTATGIVATVGILLLAPQGLVALAFALSGSDVRSWFLALYLPDAFQIAVAALLALAGAAILFAAWQLHRRSH
jgi:ABC-2 type transport system permease protein